MNILPERYARQYRDEIIARYILTIGVGVFGVAMIWTALMLPSFFYLYFQGNVLADGNAQAQSRLAQALEFRKEIERVNALTTAAVNAGNQSEYTRALMADVFSAAPAGVTVERVAYARKARTVILTGSVSTRAGLKAYVDALTQLPRVAKAEAPTENFLSSVNAKFTITVTLK